MIDVIVPRMVKEARSQVTLNLLVKAAAGLSRFRIALWIIALGAAAWFGYELYGDRPAEEGALPALTAVLWGALLLGISYSFPVGPPSIERDDGWALRLRKRLTRAAFWGMGAVAVGLGCLVVFMTVRTVTLVLR